ncbi:MAG: hypothetical protein MUQ56_01550 [Thermoleophilia bacterium]|nr:hypothetical protein [Thermoleophilia bacterium]
MTAKADRSDRDPKDDAQARQWAEEARRHGEAGQLADDSDYVARKLTEEKRKLKRA